MIDIMYAAIAVRVMVKFRVHCIRQNLCGFHIFNSIMNLFLIFIKQLSSYSVGF